MLTTWNSSVLSFLIFAEKEHTEISVWKKREAMTHEGKTRARFFFKRRNNKWGVESSDFLASSFSKRRSVLVSCPAQTVIKMVHMLAMQGLNKTEDSRWTRH